MHFLLSVVIWELVLHPLLGCKDIKVKNPDLLIDMQVQEQYLKLAQCLLSWMKINLAHLVLGKWNSAITYPDKIDF